MLLPTDTELPDLCSSTRFDVRRVNRRPGSLHFSVELPRNLRALDPPPEAVFSVTHAPAWGRTPTALMVNDVSPLRDPAWYPAATRIRLRAAFRIQIPRATVILTVSEFCRSEILADFPLDHERVFVVPNTIDPPRSLRPEEEASCIRWLEAAGVQQPFVLYLGNHHPRKNVPRLVRGFLAAVSSGRLAGHQLVLAGAAWWGGDGELDLSNTPPGSVVALGRVDEVQREHLLRSASVLAYLSLYEGFGLPPIEAMARGTPVLASDRAALPEVTGGAALLVDPTDVDSIAECLTEVATDDALRADLVRRGLARAAQHSVEATGESALAALRAAAG